MRGTVNLGNEFLCTKEKQCMLQHVCVLILAHPSSPVNSINLKSIYTCVKFSVSFACIVDSNSKSREVYKAIINFNCPLVLMALL